MPITRKTIYYLKDIPKISPQRLQGMKKESLKPLDFSDIPEVDTSWVKVKPKERENKIVTTLRLNKKSLEFIKEKQGKGYQTLINEIVTQWAKHHGMR